MAAAPKHSTALFVPFAWGVFVLLHLVNLTKFPIFEDEAQYLLLAEEIARSPLDIFFIYLKHGLLPAFGWIVTPLSALLGDSLLAGRLVSVFLASSLIFWIEKVGKLYSMPKSFVFFATAFLIVSPNLLLNTRVALLDTSVLVFTAWYLYFTAKLVRENGAKGSLGLALSLLGAFLTKATAIFGLPAAAIIVIINKKVNLKSAFAYFKIVRVYFLVFVLLVIIYIVFGQQLVADSGSSLVTYLKPDELLSKVRLNIWLTLHWFNIYYKPFLFIFLYVIFLRSIRKHELYLIMAVWLFTSMILMITLNRFYFPRHTLLFVTPLLVIMAGVLSEIPKRIAVATFFVVLFFGIRLSSDIMMRPSQAELALEDKFAYFENYTAGTTIYTIADTLRDLSRQEPITVWLDGSYVMEYGLRREAKGDSNINFKSFRLDESFLPDTPAPVFKDGERTTFVLVNRWSPPNLGQFKEIESFTVSFRHGQKLYAVP